MSEVVPFIYVNPLNPYNNPIREIGILSFFFFSYYSKETNCLAVKVQPVIDEIGV